MLRMRTSRALRSTKPPPVLAAELLMALLDRLEAHVEAGHAARVGDDAVLTDLAADGNDLCNAGNGQQLRTHGEVGQLAQRHRVDAWCWTWR